MFFKKNNNEFETNITEDMEILLKGNHDQLNLINQLLEEINEQKAMINKLQVDVWELNKVIKFLQIYLDDSKNEKLDNESISKEINRNYGDSTLKHIPKIVDVKKNGDLILKSGRTPIYSIYTLLKLLKYIPDKENCPTFIALSNKVNLTVSTTMRLCAGLELGEYEDILEKWKKLQNTINKTDDVIFVNNPEKRKELGMGGL